MRARIKWSVPPATSKERTHPIITAYLWLWFITVTALFAVVVYNVVKL